MQSSLSLDLPLPGVLARAPAPVAHAAAEGRAKEPYQINFCKRQQALFLEDGLDRNQLSFVSLTVRR